MLSVKRIVVGTEPVNLAEGSGMSAVQVQYLRNRGDTTLFLGSVEEGIPVEPGEVVPSLSLGATDRFEVVREDGEGLVHVILGWA